MRWSVLLPEDGSVNVAADEIARDYGNVKEQDTSEVAQQEICGGGEIIEGVRNAVGETADDEHRHSEQQRYPLALPCKGDHCGHYESATDGQESALPPSRGQSSGKQFQRGFVQVQRRYVRKEGNQQTSDDVACQYFKQLQPFTFLEKTCGPGEQLEFVVDYGQKAE